MTNYDISGMKPLDHSTAVTADTKLRSTTIKTLAKKGLDHPLTQAEIKEFSASVLAFLAEQ